MPGESYTYYRLTDQALEYVNRNREANCVDCEDGVSEN